MIDYQYSIVVPESMLEDATYMQRVRALLTQRAYDRGVQDGYVRAENSNPYYSLGGEPTPAYDEQGEFIGNVVELSVLVAVVRA